MLGENAGDGGQEARLIVGSWRFDDVFSDVDSGVDDPARLAVDLAQPQAESRRRLQASSDACAQALDVQGRVEPQDLARVTGHKLVLERQYGKILAGQAQVACSLP